jgi:hypothetical protein
MEARAGWSAVCMVKKSDGGRQQCKKERGRLIGQNSMGQVRRHMQECAGEERFGAAVEGDLKAAGEHLDEGVVGIGVLGEFLSGVEGEEDGLSAGGFKERAARNACAARRGESGQRDGGALVGNEDGGGHGELVNVIGLKPEFGRVLMRGGGAGDRGGFLGGVVGGLGRETERGVELIDQLKINFGADFAGTVGGSEFVVLGLGGQVGRQDGGGFGVEIHEPGVGRGEEFIGPSIEAVQGGERGFETGTGGTAVRTEDLVTERKSIGLSGGTELGDVIVAPVVECAGTVVGLGGVFEAAGDLDRFTSRCRTGVTEPESLRRVVKRGLGELVEIEEQTVGGNGSVFESGIRCVEQMRVGVPIVLGGRVVEDTVLS